METFNLFGKLNSNLHQWSYLKSESFAGEDPKVLDPREEWDAIEDKEIIMIKLIVYSL